MELIGEIRGFLAERVAGLLQDAGRQQQERVGEALQRLRQAFQALEQSLIQLEETVHGWSVPTSIDPSPIGRSRSSGFFRRPRRPLCRV